MTEVVADTFLDFSSLKSAYINPRSLIEKIVIRSLEGGGVGVNRTPLLLSTQFNRLI